MPSSPGIKPQEHGELLFILLETAIALASVIGNVLVVLVVCVNRSHWGTTFSFIVSLAVADVAVGALVIPAALVVRQGFKTQFFTCLFLTCMIIIITQSSIISLVAIAIDRYLRVKIPTRYSTVVTQGRARMAVCLCWILSFLIGLIPMLGWNNRYSIHGNLSISSQIVCRFTTVISMDYMVCFNFFGFVVVPLTIMIILYCEIFRVIRRQLNRRAEATRDSARYFQKELKLAKSLALVVFFFAVCWLPIHITNCILWFYPKYDFSKYTFYTGVILTHLNSALNPLVYAFRIERFRVTLIQITRRCMLCKPATSTPSPRRSSPSTLALSTLAFSTLSPSTPALTKKVDTVNL